MYKNKTSRKTGSKRPIWQQRISFPGSLICIHLPPAGPAADFFDMVVEAVAAATDEAAACRLGLPGKAETGLFFQKELEAFSDLPPGEVMRLMPDRPTHRRRETRLPARRPRWAASCSSQLRGLDPRPRGLSPLCQRPPGPGTHPTQPSQGHSYTLPLAFALPSPFILRRTL